MPKLKNPKHELFANNIVKENYNLTAAYLRTYPSASYESANSRSSPLVKNSGIMERVEEIANRKGLTVEYEIDSLLEIHNAMKPISFNGKVLDMFPDYATRLEATKTGLKIHGILSDNINNNIDARSLNISLEAKDLERLDEIVKTMQALRSASPSSNKAANPNGDTQ